MSDLTEREKAIVINGFRAHLIVMYEQAGIPASDAAIECQRIAREFGVSVRLLEALHGECQEFLAQVIGVSRRWLETG